MDLYVNDVFVNSATYYETYGAPSSALYNYKSGGLLFRIAEQKAIWDAIFKQGVNQFKFPKWSLENYKTMKNIVFTLIISILVFLSTSWSIANTFSDNHLPTISFERTLGNVEPAQAAFNNNSANNQPGSIAYLYRMLGESEKNI